MFIVGWRHGDDITLVGERLIALKSEAVLVEKMIIKRQRVA